MPSDDALNKRLEKFLDDQDEADTASLNRRIWNQLLEHEKKDDVRHVEFLSALRELKTEIHGEMRGLSLRVAALEKSKDKFEDKLERTTEQSGSWNLEQLREEKKEAKEKLTWWQRNWLPTTITIVSLAVAIAALFMKGH